MLHRNMQVRDEGLRFWENPWQNNEKEQGEEE
jgi:hypothetical protein